MSNLRSSAAGPRRVLSSAEFGRVAVLQGGRSSEREISLKTGAAVMAALERRGVDAHAVDPAAVSLAELAAGHYDRAFVALHGPGGEDGTMQGALEWLAIPYTGSGVLGSALCMDKLRTKQLATVAGVPTPDWRRLDSAASLERAVEALGLPLIVKPASQGSSVGMARVEDASDLAPAWRGAAALDPVVIAEKWITGAEYTVGMLQGEALPSIRVETPRSFYDYQAKYFSDDTRYHCPSGLDAKDERALAELALTAASAAGAEGWCRVDFMREGAGTFYLLEVNTIPGMTDHSLVPMAAKAAGIDFDELVWRILETSFLRERAR
jgi:D-alanine-D-alanine ligase